MIPGSGAGPIPLYPAMADDSVHPTLRGNVSGARRHLRMRECQIARVCLRGRGGGVSHPGPLQAEELLADTVMPPHAWHQRSCRWGMATVARKCKLPSPTAEITKNHAFAVRRRFNQDCRLAADGRSVASPATRMRSDWSRQAVSDHCCTSGGGKEGQVLNARPARCIQCLCGSARINSR